VIPLLLPNGRVKSLLWDCDRPSQETLCTPADLDTNLRLRDELFTPELCEAYGRLENLVIYDQISLLPVLSMFLSSLKTLLLSTLVPLHNNNQKSAQCDERVFMRAIGEMGNPEALAVTWLEDSEVRLDPETLFAASRSLRYFAFSVDGEARSFQSRIYMERCADGTICPVGHDTIFNIPYLHNGWFTFDTEGAYIH